MKNIISFFTVIIFVLATFSGCERYVKDAKDTVFQETKVSSLLKKYEWFKDAAAQLDKKRADISVYETRLRELNAAYEGVARKDWARSDMEQSNLWQTEIAGVKASYNSLAAQYNANMAKINYAFANVGELPRGADTVLPREFREYTIY